MIKCKKPCRMPVLARTIDQGDLFQPFAPIAEKCHFTAIPSSTQSPQYDEEFVKETETIK